VGARRCARIGPAAPFQRIQHSGRSQAKGNRDDSNLKICGLALFALVAMSALVTSAASAHNLTTTGVYPQHLISEDVGAADELTYSEDVLSCHGEVYTAELTAATTTIEATPEFGETCQTVGAPHWDLTITENGCKIHFEWMEHVATDHDKVKVKLVCSGTNKIEVHHYSGTPHGSPACTNTFAPQTGSGTLDATSQTATNDILLEGQVGVVTNTHGSCSFGFTLNINIGYDVSTTVRATSGARIHIA
jgi:hypothetical protein